MKTRFQNIRKAGRFLSAFLALCATLSLLCVPMFAAEVADATVNMDAECSFTLYKYDWTNAVKDGVWNEESFISTGWKESYVETTLGTAVRTGAEGADSILGNGGTSKGYAIKGVEFTILKVADVTTYSKVEGAENKTEVLYGFNKEASADLLTAIGLADGKDRYEAADTLNGENYYYTSDTLNKALSTVLAANSTTVKNALESYIATDGTAMEPTNENGMSQKSGLPVGLYLVVETKVPEMVTSTTDPFFVSLPMTTVTGNEHSSSPEGGHEWNYDVTVYPKNNTGIPTLEKTLREAQADTGKNGGSDAITDGYDHNATASAGDTVDYQIVSTLPTITSKATALTDYSFLDTIAEGVSYTKGDVILTFYKDKDCTEANKVAAWTEQDDVKKFEVAYGTAAAPATGATMTVTVNAAGLAEINGDTANDNGALYAGYSNYTLRITYTATVDSNAETVLGEEGNCNEVVLTWKRTGSEYYDTLNDDCHLYSFGVDLTKTFSDKASAEADAQFAHVKFKLYNKTDSYFVTATLTDGIYYVTSHTAAEEEATAFVPQTVGGEHGKIVIRGLEDDTYELTEIETANGYTLLKDKITVVIATAANGEDCNVYSHDVKGLLQNDPRFKDKGNLDDLLTNIPQKQLAHKKLTASATVDSNAVTMEADDASANAIAPLTVVNTRGFTPPKTGDTGMGLLTLGGIALSSLALVVVVILKKKNSKEEEK